MKTAVLCGYPDAVQRVYSQGRRERLTSLVRLAPEEVSSHNLDRMLRQPGSPLREAEIIFSTWGMPLLDGAQLDAIPNLKAVFYAAGSVQNFARPLLERGILVVSAWMANAVPVAEFTLAQILLANKGYFRNSRSCVSRQGYWQAFQGPGNFGETVAILGTGAVGRKLIELLRPFHLRVLVFDPFLSDDEAARLCVEKVSLETAFEKALVVSNHLAHNVHTEKMLCGCLFEKMRPHATFINTGRGQTVDEDAMIRVLCARSDLSALLDVTVAEPPSENSPLYLMDNVHLSSHIAGSVGDEVIRMADNCIEEFIAWETGRPLSCAVRLDQLATMA